MKAGLKYTIVGSVIIGMLLALFVIWYATDQANSHYGPSKIRVTQQGEIWILSDGVLHVLNATGVVQRSLRLKDWDRASLPSDFFPLATGELLLAEPDTHEIYRCHPNASCAPLLAGTRSVVGRTRNAMLLAVDEARQRLYVADNAGHRLLLFDLAGKLLDATGKQSARFWYPNQIELQDGELLVANTNYRKVERLSVADDRFGEASWTLRTMTAQVRPGRKWPMSFVALPNGQWWVAIAQEGMRRADVAMFNATQSSTGYIALENDADPVSMVLAGNRVLLADTEHYRIRQADLQGHPLPDFGSVAFRQSLAQQAQDAASWRQVRMAAQAGMIVLPLLAILMLWRMGERPITLPVALNFQREAKPIAAGVVQWLSPTPRFVRQQTWLLRIFLVLAMFMTGWSLWLTVSIVWQFPFGGWVLAVPLMCAVCLMLLTLKQSNRLLRSRLGTDGIQLLHDKGDGKVFAYPLAQTLSDGNRLLAGRRMIVMRAMHRMLFDRDDLEQYLLARMGSASLRSPGQLYLAGMRNGSRLIWLNSIFIILIIVAWVVARLNHFSLTAFLTKLLS